MNKVTLDKNFFNLNYPEAKGLISGLKKLSEKNFSIAVEGSESVKNENLSKILKLEGIELNNKKIDDVSKSYSVTIKDNLVFVNDKSKFNNFEDAAEYILKSIRSSVQHRKTKETDIKIEVSLDGKGKSKIKTGIGFFDHMLEQIAKHANLDLIINCKGDLNVDEHHTVEDVGITLGNALKETLGNKEGIKRYGFFLPMDDSVAVCSIDLGGRAYLSFKVKFEREKVGGFPTELTEEFFKALSSGLQANIYIRAKGKNDHHKIESIFKAFAKSLNEACRLDERSAEILPTTKGVI
jgi:imidazoleglycerol-phosphate dehydratase/histidinol-phosphatase